MNGFVPAVKTNLKQRGGGGVKGDSNTISKNRLFFRSNCVWQGSYEETQGNQDFRVHWQMAVGVRNHSPRVYLYPHCSFMQAAAKCSGSRLWRSTSEKMHAGGAPKATQRVHNSTLHVLQTPEAIQLKKLGQGLSRFKCNSAGSPEITLSDSTESQRKAFRVQVWLHRYCVKGLLSGHWDSNKAQARWQLRIWMFLDFSWHCDGRIIPGISGEIFSS